MADGPPTSSMPPFVSATRVVGSSRVGKGVEIKEIDLEKRGFTVVAFPRTRMPRGGEDGDEEPATVMDGIMLVHVPPPTTPPRGRRASG
jgi:hypothetical protein